ncbi:praja ring finger 2, E3 ubiquitin protein ligase [Puccinia graminis f. sp. tritici]|uniref:Praja ring finger 2, E3 ubiquitin protein ligase n=1 Tax=Puccinia graminis f. sp. tritici TaxID=56615 RepID=A0A5B0RAR4_PUCGR|nr:praja ring finger 2, E3 ubiquitin protein ligase [Puccinia graminis f. sp. tritici]
MMAAWLLLLLIVGHGMPTESSMELGQLPQVSQAVDTAGDSKIFQHQLKRFEGDLANESPHSSEVVIRIDDNEEGGKAAPEDSRHTSTDLASSDDSDQKTRSIALTGADGSRGESSQRIELCPICAEEWSKPYRKLPCNHLVHRCVGSWLEQNGTCPICRAPVSDEGMKASAPISNMPEADRNMIVFPGAQRPGQVNRINSQVQGQDNKRSLCCKLSIVLYCLLLITGIVMVIVEDSIHGHLGGDPHKNLPCPPPQLSYSPPPYHP